MSPTQPTVRVARIYDPPAAAGGARILVDRVWPRGVRKDEADLTEWCKDVAPSTALRKWYAHEPSRFSEFARRYRAELTEPERAAALDHLHELARQGELTLLTATTDVGRSQAAVLAELIQSSRSAAAPAPERGPARRASRSRTR